MERRVKWHRMSHNDTEIKNADGCVLAVLLRQYADDFRIGDTGILE